MSSFCVLVTCDGEQIVVPTELVPALPIGESSNTVSVDEHSSTVKTLVSHLIFRHAAADKSQVDETWASQMTPSQYTGIMNLAQRLRLDWVGQHLADQVAKELRNLSLDCRRAETLVRGITASHN